MEPEPFFFESNLMKGIISFRLYAFSVMFAKTLSLKYLKNFLSTFQKLPLIRQRLQVRIDLELRFPGSRVEMETAIGRAFGQRSVPMREAPPKDGVPERPVEHAIREEPTGERHHGRQATHSAEIRIGTGDVERGEAESLGDEMHIAFAAHPRDRASA